MLVEKVKRKNEKWATRKKKTKTREHKDLRVHSKGRRGEIHYKKESKIGVLQLSIKTHKTLRFLLKFGKNYEKKKTRKMIFSCLVSP